MVSTFTYASSPGPYGHAEITTSIDPSESIKNRATQTAEMEELRFERVTLK